MIQNENIITRIKPFQKADNLKSLWIITYSVLAIFILVILSVFCYRIHLAFSLLFWPPVFIFFCRLFVIEHDSGHFSFFTRSLHNQISGHIVGFFLMIPFSLWRYIHNLHHGTIGDLNKRNINPELWTMTTDEYINSHIGKKIAYRIMRSLAFHVLILPLALFIISKIPHLKLNFWAMLSVLFFDIVYALIFYFLLINDLLLLVLVVYIIPLYLFYIFASLIFYLQHQFEETYWKSEAEWNFIDACLIGCSFLEFKPFLKWVTGNVGYHHIHHLSSGIPFYNLSKASKELSVVIKVKPIKFINVYHYFDCNLWDTKLHKLVPFSSIKNK